MLPTGTNARRARAIVSSGEHARSVHIVVIQAEMCEHRCANILNDITLRAESSRERARVARLRKLWRHEPGDEGAAYCPRGIRWLAGSLPRNGGRRSPLGPEASAYAGREHR